MITRQELSRRRRRLKLTQKELGSMLGVNKNTVARWEMGEFFPPASLMLDKALRCIELEIVLGNQEFNRFVSQLPELPDMTSVLEPVRGIDRYLKNDEDKIRAAIAAHPDATLAELCELVKDAGGASVSRQTMWLQLKRLNLTTQRSRGTYSKRRH